MDKFQAFGKNLTYICLKALTLDLIQAGPANLAIAEARLVHLRVERSNISKNNSGKLMTRSSFHDLKAMAQADARQTELPSDYLELEKRVDALKQVHQKLLQVTSQYSNEAYDYPPNIRESFNDLGRTITEKVHLLSNASSPADVQTAFTAPPSAKPQPKTFNHAIARASLAGSQLINQTHTSGNEDSLATALEKYALAEEKVGEARMAQDAQIQSRFLAGWSTTLNTNIMFATRARKGVENARLGLDASKAKAKGAAAGRGMNPDEEMMTEESRREIEQKEDDFVAQTEEAVGVMKNVGVASASGVLKSAWLC